MQPPPNMTADELVKNLADLGMTQTELAETLGLSRTMINYYCKGRYPIPRPVQFSVICLMLINGTDAACGAND